MAAGENKKAMQEALQQRIKEREVEKPQAAIQGLDSTKEIEPPAVQGLAAGK